MFPYKDDGSFLFWGFFLTIEGSEEKEGTKGGYNSLARALLDRLTKATDMLFFIPFSSFEKNSLNMYKVAYMPQEKEIARRLNLLDRKRQSTRSQARRMTSAPSPGSAVDCPCAPRLRSSSLGHRVVGSRVSNSP